jgi:hypothetical protein
MTSIAKLLEIQFQGYFMCRIATDPDPTNEQMGVSGYTLALLGEDPLDQVVRTQIDDPAFLLRNLREPAKRMKVHVGVDVNEVLFDGKPYFGPTRDALLGAKLYLEGENPPFPGPTYDSRNNIVGSDDNMMFVVNPFQMVIRKKRPGTEDDLIALRAEDWLNPADPEQKIWQIEDPATYARRLPVSFSSSSVVAQAAIRAFDGYTYFADRVKFLRQEIAELEKLQREADDTVRARLEAKIQGLRTRIYQLELWGGRFETKLAFQLTYSFNVNGPQTVHDPDGLLHATIDTEQPWPVTFWFGSWDGDLLLGYMQGGLSVPFRPAGG